ncbi:hypothetical protein NE237_005232 [Protea cynaroides]|uniref:Uncharacterized protein n=1 Tax=Protea cynaroides TaxID=273540 RepID=A0A9Q0QU92_9MAGN|nr:hypothetical protein NE237_005232 [Protea cynaroides]
MEAWLRVLLVVVCLFPAMVECSVRHYKFNVVMRNTTKLCSSKPIVTVNGRFPGRPCTRGKTITCSSGSPITSITTLRFTGMGSDSFGRVGMMDRLTLHNAQSNRVKATPTISPSLVKEAHYCGMHTSYGYEPHSMVASSSCRNGASLTRFLNPIMKWLSS